ncbi:T9SS type A sorting domain-containing protein [Sunxiuqinia elliptica]|uniref:Putative secreted protein (Por secretion system target) n=1 Tax=Sunxiuqinia elliptica TaxID=655355 RepID=A0A4V3BWV8_9BACT|nr:T9SS type A sorting domain-containing protein [Sunxiuqinia elliptica]TDN96638.1 putative secreted protein (Por secretion system target) [Sunxiuqinia elliptica]TDO55803.1 putative secreted protein (Por secretion system target) [Sunxiuqinia elliptica]
MYKLLSKYKIKILCFIGLFSLVSISNAQTYKTLGFWEKTWSPKTFTSPDSTSILTLSTGDAPYTIKINSQDTIAPFLPTQLGLNTTFRSGSDMYHERIDNYRRANMGAFRFPAGSGSNIYFWDGNIPDNFLIDINPIDGTSKKALKLTEFLAFIDSLDAEATLVINYFYARYGKTKEGTRAARVQQAANYAAAFVRYVNKTLGANVKNWEIGNECYGKWEQGYNVNGNIVTGTEYGEDFRVFAEAMKKIDPTIKVGAVMWSKSEIWNDQVIKEVKDHADFLIVHNYFTTEEEATISNILDSPVQIEQIKTQMENCILRNTNFNKNHFPVAMTEYNCRGAHTTTFINACFTAEVIGRMVASKYGLATRWVGEWPWKEGTHGLFAIDDPQQKDYSARQAYMIYHYYGKAFGDHMVQATSSNPQIKTFASVFSDGKLGIVLSNATEKEMSINLVHDKSDSGKAWLYEVYATSVDPDDRKFYVNNQTSSTRGGGPDNFEDIPPYQINYTNKTIIKLKPYSVTFIVLSTQLLTKLDCTHSTSTSINIYPNPTHHQLFCNYQDKFEAEAIYNCSGYKVKTLNSNFPVNVDWLKRGHYFLSLKSSHSRVVKQFIKQ